MIAAYVLLYTIGRAFTENLRIDTVELDDVGGLRFNVWTSIVLFALAAVYLVVSQRLRPGREDAVYLPGREPEVDGEPDPAVDAVADPEADPEADPVAEGAPGATADASADPGGDDQVSPRSPGR
jgi:hypothetical protein